jgi:hypothetical protein
VGYLCLRDDKETTSSAEMPFFLLLIPFTEGFADCSLFEQLGKALRNFY